MNSEKNKLGRGLSALLSSSKASKAAASERLLSKKLDMRNINIMRPWKDALFEYINESYDDMIIKK